MTEPAPAPSLAEPPAMRADLLEAVNHVEAGAEQLFDAATLVDPRNREAALNAARRLVALAARLRTYATETLPTLERDARGPATFTVYRRGDLSETHDANQVNPSSVPQFEGVVFSDGRVAIRWLTACRSVSVWDSIEDAFAVHGHPEACYGTEIIWHAARRAAATPTPEEAR